MTNNVTVTLPPEGTLHINEEQLAFYFNLGSTLTQWAHVERALLDLAVVTFHTDNKKQIVALYWGIDSFSRKLSFVDVILRENLDDSQLSAWASLKTKAETFSKIRNRMAHDMVISSFEGESGKRKWLNSKRNESKMHLVDIVHARYKFFALMCGIENYACAISGQPNRFSKEIEEVKPPPTIEEIKNEIYLYLPENRLK